MKNQTWKAENLKTEILTAVGGQKSDVRQQTAFLPAGSPPIPPATLAGFLTRPEVAQLVNASVSTVDRLVVDGHLQRVKVRRLVRFSPAEVEAFLKQKAESAGRTGQGKLKFNHQDTKSTTTPDGPAGRPYQNKSALLRGAATNKENYETHGI